MTLWHCDTETLSNPIIIHLSLYVEYKAAVAMIRVSMRYAPPPHPRSILIRFVDFWRIAAGFKLSMAVYTANIEETKKP